jgi:hypothetical protein
MNLPQSDRTNSAQPRIHDFHPPRRTRDRQTSAPAKMDMLAPFERPSVSLAVSLPVKFTPASNYAEAQVFVGDRAYVPLILR